MNDTQKVRRLREKLSDVLHSITLTQERLRQNEMSTFLMDEMKRQVIRVLEETK